MADQSLNNMTERTLAYVTGVDINGRGGRQAATAFATAAQGTKADAALLPSAQTFTSPQKAQIQENIGIDADLILILLTAVAASLPTSAPSGARGLWRNGEAGLICYSNQSDLT